MALNEKNLEKRFAEVSASQGGIQTLSFYCLHHKGHHKKITQIWLRSLQKAKVSHRLTLIYLANDIVQNAKRKNALSFINDFKTILKETIPYLKDEKIRKSVERVFSIWQDRSIFDGHFTTELKNSLNGIATAKAPTTIVEHSDQSSLMECLNRLASIEKNKDNKDYATQLKSEIDERIRLMKLLEDLTTRQKRLLEESETELNTYKARLQHVTKLRTINT